MHLISLLPLLSCLLGASASLISPYSPSLRLRLLSRSVASNVSTVAGITSVALTGDKQTYYAVAEAGGLNFRLALDTGSADLWIMGSSCVSSVCKGVPQYPLGRLSPSFSAVNDNQTAFRASYADGTSVSGFVAQEKIVMANVTVPSQAFAIITQANVSLSDDVSGLIGLGFPRLSSISSSVTNSTPFFTSLARQGILDYPLFGLSLTNDGGGSLTLGAIDSDVVTNVSAISWNPVVQFSPQGTQSNASSYLFWATPLTSFSVANHTLIPNPTYPLATGNSSLGLFDVGNSGIYGPFQDVERLFSLIDGSRIVDERGIWAIPCDTAATITFRIGSQNYTLSPADYLIGAAAGNPQVCLSWPQAAAPSPDGIDWQFGTPFLRTVYSVFSHGIDSAEAPRVGFYSLKNATVAQPASASLSQSASSASATVTSSFVPQTIATTLPNSLLPTPIILTPPYAFNTSIPASIGGIVTAGLATSTYSPILAQKHVTSLPSIAFPPAVTTILTTDARGITRTTTSIISTPPVTLGLAAGRMSSSTRSCSVSVYNIAVLLLLCRTLYHTIL